jgi:hypothetical protein
MGQKQKGKIQGIPLKRSEGMVLIMDTPKGTFQVDYGDVIDIASPVIFPLPRSHNPLIQQLCRPGRLCQ